jgi:DNA polymerase I
VQQTTKDSGILLLVDGSSFLYRAYHALPPLSNSHGEPTGAVYGVINMLNRLVRELAPICTAIVFDAPGRTFRDDIFEHYKLNRPPMPDDLSAQMGPVSEIIKAMGFPLLQIPGVEADDAIATLACRASQEGFQVLIATSDKDLAQLVGNGIALVNSEGSILNRQGVIDKFGVAPERIVDFLALTGDKVDNIPGVPGVGPKTAAKWLEEYGSLEGVIANAENVGGKIGEKLRAALPDLPRSYELATVRRDIELGDSSILLKLCEPNVQALRQIYARLEFKAWLAELPQPIDDAAAAEATHATPAANYEVILTQTRFAAWLETLKTAELMALDVETDSPDYMRAQAVGLSFAVEPGRGAYVPLGHDYAGAPEQLSRAAVLGALRPLLEDEHKAKLGHNLKLDRNVLANYGISMTGIKHDSMIESYVLNSTASRHDLDTLSEAQLGQDKVHLEDIAGKGAKQLSFNEIRIEQAACYASAEADLSLRLHHHFWPKLCSMPDQRKLYETIEVPLIEVLSRLERNGVLVDANQLGEQSQELAARLVSLEQQAYALAGGSFNLGSPKQIQELLYDRLKLPVKRKTPTGQPSTAEDVLQELALNFPLPRIILEHRALSKLKSTYTDKLPEQINPVSGRIHTCYHQAVASTGRLSSADPNLQNIPIRTDEGRRIRQAFVAPPGSVILSCDYSQIELRIMAHLSQDPGLIRAFESGLDVHQATAAEVFGLPTGEVSPDQRRAAKAINFGLIYGMSAFGLARQLGLQRDAAQAYVDRYFDRYPGVRTYMETTRALAREQGYVETVFGRRLYLPEIRSRDAQRRQYAERTAINAPMQGTAADIIKRAMIATERWLREEVVSARMIMQVHDELVFEVDVNAADIVKAQTCKLMEQAAELSVSLRAEAGVGSSWGEAH